MVSSRKLVANRANAQRSTGPRSAEGKARSRGNALRHGLAVPASAIPDLAPEVAHLAQLIVGNGETDPALLEAAARVAEAAVDVLRARRARTELLGRMAQHAKFLPIPAAEPMPTQLLSYKSSPLGVRIQAVLNGTIDELHRTELAQIREVLKSHEERQRIMQHNTDVRQRLADWDQLAKLARYERRALSRRNAAIRAFDELRVSAGEEIG